MPEAALSALLPSEEAAAAARDAGVPLARDRSTRPPSALGWTYIFDYVRFGRGVDILPSRFDECERDGD
jgi:hypothetical protein